MTPPAHFAIVNRSKHVPTDAIDKIATACDTQMREDYLPIWGRVATVTSFHKESLVPVHFWKVIIEDNIGQPGALGFHTDELGQPVCYVAAQGGDLNAISVTCSHEIIEATTDPFGNRLIPSWHPKTNVPVRILAEPCDPSEAETYARHGNLPVSDFYYPEWFDLNKTPNQKYTLMDAINAPRQIIQGGYMSFVDADGAWWQLTQFGTMFPNIEGPFDWKLDADHHSLRSIVDESVRLRKSQAV